ncbi:hypothetical protein M8J77_006156 [Diaphorina citri]|nr:hypothetical protein M8J77_006156 [Diaphorina citri]
MSSQVVLGIDIGTTSVKVCLIDANTREELSSESKDTQANIPSAHDSNPGAHEQNVRKIVSTLHNCILRLPKDHLKQVKHIGICGQMHGIVLWRSPAWTDKFELINEHISNLITWQDTRCDHAYLTSLPRPDSHLRAYTGYGINTLLWYMQHEPQTVLQYTHAATIQDFIVAMLCDLQEPVMSNQNAASWGYFNCKLSTWNEQILRNHEPSFPLHLLPKIQPSGTIVGTLTRDWLGINKDTPINVALGDLQCSVLATLQYHSDAIVNISTSAQIAFIDESFVPQDHYVNVDTGNNEETERNVTELKETRGPGDTEAKRGEKINLERTNTKGVLKRQSHISGESNTSQNEAHGNLDSPGSSGETNANNLVDKTSEEATSCDKQTNTTRLCDGDIDNTLDNASEDQGYDEVDPVPTRQTSERNKASPQVRNEPNRSNESSSSNDQEPPTSSQTHIEHFPYFHGKYIAVGASMNGGNCLATFVCTLQNWFKEFGFNVPQNQIWAKLINASDPINHITRHHSTLRVTPTLLGDRHVIAESASVTHITIQNLGVTKLFVALCEGIINNIHDIMNRSVLHRSGINRIIGIGSCLTRNHILQHYIERIYGLQLIVEQDQAMRDASYGAAISTIV